MSEATPHEEDRPDDRGDEEGGAERRPARPASTEEEDVDIREKGGMKGGERQVSDRRLFMQLQAFRGASDLGPVVEAVRESGLDAVLYKDLNHPRGCAVLTISEDPAHFGGPVRDLLTSGPFADLRLADELTMLGRTYAIGYEPDLTRALIDKPRGTALNPDWRWAIWYPLRRSGAFARLSEEDQRRILGEHGRIGIAYGRADLAHDVRLACFGLDRNDNDFVIGVIGRELYPLSAVVQRMRSTEQTSEYIETLGPFFVGHAVYQSEV